MTDLEQKVIKKFLDTFRATNFAHEKSELIPFILKVLHMGREDGERDYDDSEIYKVRREGISTGLKIARGLVEAEPKQTKCVGKCASTCNDARKTALDNITSAIDQALEEQRWIKDFNDDPVNISELIAISKKENIIEGLKIARKLVKRQDIIRCMRCDDEKQKDILSAIDQALEQQSKNV